MSGGTESPDLREVSTEQVEGWEGGEYEGKHSYYVCEREEKTLHTYANWYRTHLECTIQSFIHVFMQTKDFMT